MAARVKLHRALTICNIYTSDSHIMNATLLNSIYQQLPQPCLVVGDFKAHIILWGSRDTRLRGREIEDFMTSNGLPILNNRAPTHITHSVESAIDLSICSPQLTTDFYWSVSSTPGDSDHCYILITYEDPTNDADATNWNVKQARWDAYRTSPAWDNLPDCRVTSCDDLLIDLYQRITEASTESIPQFIRSKYFPKPWWNKQVKESNQQREVLYQRYRRNRTMHNLIQWKRKRAEHKKLVKESKRTSWREFVGSINYQTPSSALYQKMRRIKGTAQRKVNILHENGQSYSSIPEIAEKLAQTFCAVSGNDNYTNDFMTHKTHIEAQHIDFTSSNSETYNKPFTVEKLNHCLRHTRDTSPGIDQVHYKMIKHMPEAAKTYLTNIFNKFYTHSFFPAQWKTALVTAIPKPGKDHSNPTNYRPIALTSCLCKTLERLINDRLLDYLEANKKFSNIQCGCRRYKSTTDHLVRLENQIRTAFAKGEHFVSIFFDIEKAYDMTWRYGILKDLYNTGIRGYLPNFIAEFLKARQFKVVLQNYTTANQVQQNGVPQGSVLAVTLFAIKINSLAKVIPDNPHFLSSLYVDDLQVGMRHVNLEVIEQEMQQCLLNIQLWTNENGFKFSTAKTKAMHFSTLPGLHLNKPTLRLANNTIPYVDSIRFLGMQFDSKLTWKEHINKLRADCTKLIGIMRTMTSHDWGADQHGLMKIYRTYIRAKLDYGSQVYSSASETLLKSLNPIATEALRIATGAFKCTPVETLYTLADEMSLELRRNYLCLRYYYKIESHLDNPSNKYLIPLSNRALFNNKKIALPLSLRAQNILESIN